MININDDRKERKAARTKEKATMKKDYRYFIYESLEYGRNNQNRDSLGLHTELMKSFIR
jgi:hypothetical protein